MPDPTKVRSVAEFVAEISKLKLQPDRMRFFRGHAVYKKYELKPSVYRAPHFIANEQRMIEEAIVRCPGDFPESLSFFERLVRLQHYGLPTRLLDLTSNALVALYFACQDKERTEGEIVVFDIPRSEVEYYSSDTVSIIANLARRRNGFNLSKLPDDTEDFNKTPEIQQLIYDIKQDKPAFCTIIKKQDLSQVLCVRAKQDSFRIQRQDGAFLLFGIQGKNSECATVPPRWCVCGDFTRRIIFSNKHKMKRELEQFGVSGQALFPELESQSRWIKMKFEGRYLRKRKAK